MVTYKEKLIVILVLNSIVLSILAREGLNPIVFWIILPIYIGYTIVNKAYKIKSRKKLWEGYGFLIASLGISYFYLIQWFFDVDDIRTGSSTSVLLLFTGPMMAVFVGFIGYFIGSFVSDGSKEDGE